MEKNSTSIQRNKALFLTFIFSTLLSACQSTATTNQKSDIDYHCWWYAIKKDIFVSTESIFYSATVRIINIKRNRSEKKIGMTNINIKTIIFDVFKNKNL